MLAAAAATSLAKSWRSRQVVGAAKAAVRGAGACAEE